MTHWKAIGKHHCFRTTSVGRILHDVMAVDPLSAIRDDESESDLMLPGSHSHVLLICSKVVKYLPYCMEFASSWIDWLACHPLARLNQVRTPIPGQFRPLAGANCGSSSPSHLLALRRAASRLHQLSHRQGAWLRLSTRSLTADVAHSEQGKKKEEEIICLIKTSGGNAGQRHRRSLRLPMSQCYVRGSPTFPHESKLPLRTLMA